MKADDFVVPGLGGRREILVSGVVLCNNCLELFVLAWTTCCDEPDLEPVMRGDFIERSIV
jgi:hypothetical protein